MAGVDIGGDESVMWRAYGDNVRKDRTLIQTPTRKSGWLQSAVDEAHGNFTITIALPQTTESAAAFFESVRNAVDTCEKQRSPLTLTLPIERGHHNQIQVTWTSDRSTPHPNSPKVVDAFAKANALFKAPKKAAAKSTARSSNASIKKSSKRR